MTDPQTPSVAKSDYLMAIVQRTEPKFLTSFRPQIDSVMNNALQVHPQDSLLLHTAAVYYYSTDRKDMAKKHFKANIQAWPESLSAAAMVPRLWVMTINCVFFVSLCKYFA